MAKVVYNKWYMGKPITDLTLHPPAGNLPLYPGLTEDQIKEQKKKERGDLTDEDIEKFKKQYFWGYEHTPYRGEFSYQICVSFEVATRKDKASDYYHRVDAKHREIEEALKKIGVKIIKSKRVFIDEEGNVRGLDK